jgi:hypothetical protein
MNTMNMPGFTADKSVYKTNGYYRLSAGNADGIASPPGLVQPMQLQMPIPGGAFRPDALTASPIQALRPGAPSCVLAVSLSGYFCVTV